jgi:hypothetical protein
MIKTLLLLFLFYLIYRFIRFFVKNVKVTYRSGHNPYNQGTHTNRQYSNPKYKNIEEAEFTEIKSEPEKPGHAEPKEK